MAKKKTTQQIVDELIERKTKEAQAKSTKKPTKPKVEKEQKKVATNNGAKTEQTMKVPKAKKIKRAVGIALGAVGLATAVVVPIVVYNSNKNIIVSIYHQNSAFARQSIQVKKGTKAKDLAIIEFEGYEFQGYFKDEACTIPLEADEKITANTTIYASYRQFFNLTLNINDEENTYKIYADETLAEALERLGINLEKTGYEFQGLYTSTDYLTKYNLETPLTENITLHAYYKQLLTLTLNINGETTTYTVYKGETLTEALKRLEITTNKDGYEFQGYFTNPEYTSNFNTNSAIEADTIVYLYYKQLLTLKLNIGGEVTDYTIYHGETLAEALKRLEISTTKEGYEFQGYYLDENHSTAISENYVLTENTVLYLYYKQLLTLTLYNGNTVVESGTIYNGDTLATALSKLDFTPELQGFEFLGYFTDAACENQIGADDTITADKTSIYLSYIELHTLTLNVDGEVTEGTIYHGDTLSEALEKLGLETYNYNTTCGFFKDEGLTQEIALESQLTEDEFIYTEKATSEYLTFTLNDDDSYTVSRNTTSYNGEIEIILPKTYQDKPVTTMGLFSVQTDNGGYYEYNLTSIIIPSSIEYLTDNVFNSCSRLKTVYFIENSQLSSISNNAFYNCTALTTITIPSYVTSIGRTAFYNCAALTTITIPSSLTTIDSYAFRYCEGLQSVQFEDDSALTSIGKYAFHHCISLDKITLPSSLQSIGDYAFYDCKGLTEITIPASVESMGALPFLSCDALTEIVIDEDSPYFTSIDGADQNTCIIDTTSNTLIYGTDSTVIPDYVTRIGSHAFYGCLNLVTITIPQNVTQIGSSAFSACYNLNEIIVDAENAVYTSIDGADQNTCIIHIESNTLIKGTAQTVIPTDGSVTTIAYYAFGSCKGLTSITIPASVTSIGKGAFDGCSLLNEIIVDTANTTYTSIDGADQNTCIIDTTSNTLICGTDLTVIPDGVSSIGYAAFSSHYNLKSIIIPSSVTKIDISAFQNCSGLESVTFADSRQVISIGQFAFYNCAALTSITIPSSVTSIGQSAFYNCAALTSITIPSSVESTGNYAFFGCESLTSITFEEKHGYEWYVAGEKCSDLTSDQIKSYAKSGLMFTQVAKETEEV